MPMADDTLFDRTATMRRPRGRRSPPVIDQDGNEVHTGGFGAGPLGASGLNAEDLGFTFTPLTREQRFARIEALAKLLDVAFVLPARAPSGGSQSAKKGLYWRLFWNERRAPRGLGSPRRRPH